MDTLGILAELYSERDRINQAIAALESLNGSTPTPKTVKTSNKAAAHVGNGAKTASLVPSSTKKRVVSPEARQRMADAQQKRWAKKKRAEKAAAKKAAVGAPTPVKPAKTAPVATPGVKKVGKPMSEATKKKLAVAAKARWAAKSAEKAATA